MRGVGAAAVLQRTGAAIFGAGQITKGIIGKYLACGLQGFSLWAGVKVAFPVICKVGAREGTVRSIALVPDGNMRINATIHKSLECLSRSIGRIGGETLGFETEATYYPFDHRYADQVLINAIGARALGIDDDAQLVVDQIIGVIDEV